MSRKNKYPGNCIHCSERIDADAGLLVKSNGRWAVVHESQPCVEPESAEDKQQRSDNQEFSKGYAEAKQYMSDVRTYGRDQAEQWEMQNEWDRYMAGH